MDVFSLLKFWQHAGVGDPGNLDITSDDGSFFDLVFTSPNNLHSPTAVVFFNNNNKRKVLPLDLRSPFRVLKLGFQKKTKSEIEEVTIGSLLKSDNSLASSETPSPSKRFSKDVIHKYLNLIKPLYTKVSGRSNQNKHLCKSRSSSAGKLTPSPAARSYDSALQQDGIQSAILHCKRSYNSPSHFGCDVLSRSGSAPSQGRPRISLSIDEEKRSSI